MVNRIYWPTVLVLCICFLATLYHVSVPVRTRWRYNLPGAVFTMFCWVFGSALLRIVLVETASGSTSIYGPLAAPIAVLLWLYLLSIAVLIGAALNAAFDQIWPQKELTTARLERLKRLKLENVLPWRTSLEGEASEQGALREGERPCRARPVEPDATPPAPPAPRPPERPEPPRPRQITRCVRRAGRRTLRT